MKVCSPNFRLKDNNKDVFIMTDYDPFMRKNGA